MQKNLIFIICLLTGLSPLITACQPHRIDVQQGNRIKPEVRQQLKLGMNRNQVVFLLGTPLLQDPFHQDRWDYLYYMKPGNDKARQSSITLYFEGDLLSKIDDSRYRPEMHGDSRLDNIDINDPPPDLSTRPDFPVED